MIAISWHDLYDLGCPYCRSKDGFIHVRFEGGRLWVCRNCNRDCIAVNPGLTRSPIGIAAGNTIVFPKVQSHPGHHKY